MWKRIFVLKRHFKISAARIKICRSDGALRLRHTAFVAVTKSSVSKCWRHECVIMLPFVWVSYPGSSSASASHNPLCFFSRQVILIDNTQTLITSFNHCKNQNKQTKNTLLLDCKDRAEITVNRWLSDPDNFDLHFKAEFGAIWSTMVPILHYIHTFVQCSDHFPTAIISVFTRHLSVAKQNIIALVISVGLCELDAQYMLLSMGISVEVGRYVLALGCLSWPSCINDAAFSDVWCSGYGINYLYDLFWVPYFSLN